ncbi:HET domain containing protein, partial [Rhypophila sp. PSN 637]
MRLLHTQSLSLSEFYGDDIPPYAILSHRWGQEEVTFDDLTKGLAPTRQGFAKLQGFCRQAAADGFEYCWVDTCCIDKSSSAELTEALNSMFSWYQNSEVCLVYLQDVDSSLDPNLSSSLINNSFEPIPNCLRDSEWFTRGWALQELVAPLVVSFHGSDWRFIGSRTTLGSILSRTTNIDLRFFETLDLSPYTIAQKMSWAAKRKTTRIEDQAYCLMGLFGINMPLLYGEGEKAFKRLQEEIIRQSTDFSIFAATTEARFQSDSFLAARPAAFA